MPPTASTCTSVTPLRCMIWRAMSRPVRPLAARTREYCWNVLCTLHCAHIAKPRAGRSRMYVGSKNGKNMWGWPRSGTAQGTRCLLEMAPDYGSPLFDVAACVELSGGCKTGQAPSAMRIPHPIRYAPRPMTLPPVDLRSDTVTRPTAAMRRAMAEAEVGDDVFGDDPTVIELERRVAVLAGKAAALFVPSGTMGNQLAVNVQTRPADEVLLEAESHIYFYEQGGIAANSGCLAHPLRGERAVLPLDTLIAALGDDDDHVARVTLVCAENPHNRAGGAVVPLARLREL